MKTAQTLNAVAALERYRLKRGALGYFLALMAGLTYPFLNIFWAIAQGMPPYMNALTIWDFAIVGVTVAAVSDLAAGAWMVIWNLFHHRKSEYIRALRSRSGRICIVAGLWGGPIAMGCVCVAVNITPIPYVMAISATFPVFGAIFGAVALREKMHTHLWMGIIVVSAGAALVSWGPPAGDNYPYFAIGIILSFVSAIGLALDCCTGTYGMDLLDPNIAVGIKLFSSSLSNSIIILPILGLLSGEGLFAGWRMLASGLTTMPSIIVLVFGAIFGATTWLVNYVSMSIIGAGRGIAINASFAVFGIPISLLFQAFGLYEFQITFMCVIGSIILFIGAILVVLNPKELLSIRSH
jgi:drug/metabolite transporter (DMT)-like permease